MLKLKLIIFFTALAGFAYGQPVFKGGRQALYTFLSQKIVYPEYSKQNCISGTIKVSFMVDKAGKVYKTRIIDGPGIDLDDEAIRVIKLTSGKWTVPANHSGDVIILPIRFDISGGQCGLYNFNNISQAITAYKNQQQLQDVVTGYYAAKYTGKADTTHEATIISLKKQLGFTDKYIDDILQQADAKLQQGDKAGACHDWQFIRNIGSNRADGFLAKYCAISE